MSAERQDPSPAPRPSSRPPRDPVSEGRRRLAAFALAAAGTALVLALVVANLDLLGDSFWYLATGKWILSHGRLPDVDPFSFASTRGPWIVHMPGAQLVFAWLERTFGLGSLLVVGALVKTAAAVAIWLGATRTHAGRLSALPLVVVGLALEFDDLAVRGQLFGDLAFAWLLLTLRRIERGAVVSRFAPFALGAVWIELHSSFFLAIALPLVMAFAVAFERGAGVREVGALGRFALYAALGSLVTPYGPYLALDLVHLVASPTTAAIDLFRSPSFRDPLTLVVLGVGVFGIAWSSSSPALSRRTEGVVLLAVFWLAACWARRWVPLLATVEIVVLGGFVEDRFVERGLRVTSRAALGAAFALGAAAAMLAGPPHDPVAQMPNAAVAFVDQASAPDRLYAAYHFGGYLEWAVGPTRRVMIDGRNQLFENGAFEDAMVIDAAAPGFRDLLDAYEIGTIVHERGGALDRALATDLDWTKVFEERIGVVWVRSSLVRRRRSTPSP